MVWGCISSFGVGELVFVDDIMDKNMYLSILKNNLKKSVRSMGIGEGFNFYQDNDPKLETYRNSCLIIVLRC